MLVSCFPGGFQKLKMDRVNNESDLLRLNGFYYSLTDSSNTDLDSGGTIEAYIILYKNGVILGSFATSKNIEEIKNTFEDAYYLRQIQKVRTFWGVYQISDSTLMVETWYPQTFNYYRIRHEAKIIDSATFEFLDESWGDLMHFYPYNVKPDSINPFID